MDKRPTEIITEPLEEAVENIRKDKEQVLVLNIYKMLTIMEEDWEKNGFNSEEAAFWMVLLATLLEWKMQFLLPRPAVEEEVELQYNREDHLEEYRMFKEAANLLKEMAEERSLHISREIDDKALGIKPADNLQHALSNDVGMAFHTLLLKEEPPYEEYIEAEDYDVESQMEYVLERVQRFAGRVRFEQLFRPGSSRALLVVTFLALLELVRLGSLQIEQERPYAELWIGVRKDDS